MNVTTAETLSEITEVLDTVQEAIPGRGKPSVSNPLGRPSVDLKEYTAFQAKPLEDKRKYLTDQWTQLAYLTLSKANSFALTVTKKDFGRLMQLATVAGIGWDKVFPKGVPDSHHNLVLNIFNGLPREKVLKVIGRDIAPRGSTVGDCTDLASIDNIPKGSNVNTPT